MVKETSPAWSGCMLVALFLYKKSPQSTPPVQSTPQRWRLATTMNTQGSVVWRHPHLTGLHLRAKFSKKHRPARFIKVAG